VYENGLVAIRRSVHSFLSLVQTQDGVTGAALWFAGTAAPDFMLDHVTAGGQFDRAQKDRNAGGSQSGLDNQLLFANEGTFDQDHTINELGSDDNPTRTSDGHTVQAKPNTWLSIVEGISPVSGIVDKNSPVEANINPPGTLIDECSIGASDLDTCFESSTPSGERATPNFEIFDFEKVSLEYFQLLPGLVRQGE